MVPGACFAVRDSQFAILVVASWREECPQSQSIANREPQIAKCERRIAHLFGASNQVQKKAGRRRAPVGDTIFCRLKTNSLQEG